MIVVTTETVPGRDIEAALGLVRGSSVRARHVGGDIAAALRNLVGGEVSEYTSLLSQARDRALERMCEAARAEGADAVVAMRLETTQIAQTAAEIVAYGTAVRLAP